MTNWSRAGESSRDGSGALTQMRQSFDGASQLIENGRQQLRQGDAQIASVESVAQSMSRQQRSAAPRAQSEEVNVALDTRRSVVSELLDDYNYTRSQSLESNRASAASLASSELTRASNIVQIAYIPGVTGRGGGLDVIGGPSTSAAPGPSADRESRSVSEYSSTHSEDLYSAPPPRGPGHRTLPSDVTAATLDIGARASMLPSGSAAQEPQAPRPSSSIYSADRDSQSIRDSQVERASHRESIASNYREEAIASPLPAQTIVAGRARPVVIGSEQQQLGSSQQAPSPNAQPGLATLPATTFTPQRREARQPPEQAAAESSRAQQRQSRGESDGERSRSPSPQAQQRATRDGQRRDTQLPSRPGPGQGRNR
jgi:hypothetical protein